MLRLYDVDARAVDLRAPVRPTIEARGGETGELFDLARKLWRRKGFIAATVMLLMILAIAAVFLLTPRYTASAFVLINPPKTDVIDVQAVLSGLPTDQQSILSQAKVLSSRNLAARAVKALSLDRNPEFNTDLLPPTIVTSAMAAIRQLLTSAGLIPPNTMTDEQRAEKEQITVVDNFLDDLVVTPQAGSSVIQIAFSSDSPRTAASVVNTLADLYIAAQVEAKSSAVEHANEFLDEQLKVLQKKTLESEKAVEDYRASKGLIKGKLETEGATISSEQISDLGTQLVEAQARRAEADARLAQAEGQASSNGSAGVATEILESPLIQKLREQEADLSRALADAKLKFGPTHPQMVALKAQMSNLQATIAVETRKIINALRKEAMIARDNEKAIEAKLDELKIQVGGLNEADVQLRALEREADANKLLLQAFLTRSVETNHQESSPEPDAEIISRAAVPQQPSFPQTKLILMASFLMAVFVAILLALAIESLDRGIRSAEQVRRLMGVRSLGLVPGLKTWRWSSRRPEDYVLKRPDSAFAESIRIMNADLALMSPGQSSRTVLITSAVPAEGKTTIAVSLARLVAARGRKVLIIDCDLRHPSLHRSFGATLSPGLVELLSGTASMETALRQDRKSSAHVIPAGKRTQTAAELLGSERMKALLSELGGFYDMIILDSAPVLAVSETRMLPRFVDKTVFVVRWAATHQKTVKLALEELIDGGADIAGVLLTRVDVKKNAKYDFGDSHYYSSGLRKFYAD
jgi:capsular exopolysaccharide synthesis family protein